MKTTILATAAILALASLMSVSCDKTDRPSKGTIGFKVVSHATKGTIVTTDNIKTQHGAFYVDLIDSNGEVVNNDEDYKPVLGEKVTWDGSAWTLAHITYWKDRTINAWAYSPAVLNGGALSVITPTSIDGTVSHTYDGGNGDGKIYIDAAREKMIFNFLASTDAATQDDLLFAYTSGCTNKTTGKDGTPGQIPIHFYHALSAIQFECGAIADADKTKYEFGNDVKINSITINNVRSAGTCEFDVTKTGSLNADIFTWDTSDNGVYDRCFGPVSATFGTAGFAVPTDKTAITASGNECTLFLIPQEMNTEVGKETTLTINWSKGGEEMPSRTVNITTRNGEIVEWVAGYKYLYTVRIGKRETDTSVELSVLPWDFVEYSINYSDQPACTSALTLSPASTTLTNTAIADQGLVTGKFTLDGPIGAQWLVSLTDPENFDVYASNGSINPAMGTIDGNEAVFYIKPKTGVSRDVTHTTALKVTILHNGSYVNAPDALDDDAWSVVLNPIK